MQVMQHATYTSYQQHVIHKNSHNFIQHIQELKEVVSNMDCNVHRKTVSKIFSAQELVITVFSLRKFKKASNTLQRCAGKEKIVGTAEERNRIVCPVLSIQLEVKCSEQTFDRRDGVQLLLLILMIHCWYLFLSFSLLGKLKC